MAQKAAAKVKPGARDKVKLVKVGAPPKVSAPALFGAAPQPVPVPSDLAGPAAASLAEQMIPELAARSFLPAMAPAPSAPPLLFGLGGAPAATAAAPNLAPTPVEPPQPTFDAPAPSPAGLPSAAPGVVPAPTTAPNATQIPQTSAPAPAGASGAKIIPAGYTDPQIIQQFRAAGYVTAEEAAQAAAAGAPGAATRSVAPSLPPGVAAAVPEAMGGQAPPAADPEELARKLQILSALGGVGELFGLGTASFMAQHQPGITSAALLGNQAYQQDQYQKGMQSQVAALAQRKQMADERDTEHDNRLADRKQSQDEEQFDLKYRADLAEFKRKAKKDELDDTNERAGVQRQYLDLFRSLTPASQQQLFAKLDPEFVSYYGITLPEQGLEQRNPNEPTKPMLLQKDLEAQYRLLARDPKLLTPAAQKQIVAKIRELREALGIAGEQDDQALAAVFSNVDPAERERLRIQLAGHKEKLRANRAAETDRDADRRSRDAHNRATEGVAAQNARTAAFSAQTGRINAGLREQELALRKELQNTAKGQDPMALYMKMSNYVQELQRQKAAFTKGTYSPLTGQWMAPDPEMTQLNTGTIAWINQQIELYTATANNLGQRLGLPAMSTFSGAQPMQVGTPAASAPSAARPPASGARRSAPAGRQSQGAAPSASRPAPQRRSSSGGGPRPDAIAATLQNMQAVAAELERRQRGR